MSNAFDIQPLRAVLGPDMYRINELSEDYYSVPPLSSYEDFKRIETIYGNKRKAKIDEGPATFESYKIVKRTKKMALLPNGQLDLKNNASRFSAVTEANAKSLFLALPAEIRNQIYEYVLGGYVFYAGHCYLEGNKMKVKSARFSQYPPHQFALLRTCRQIYNDTALLPYTLNAFSVSTRMDLHMVVDLLPVQAAAISRVLYEFEPFGSYLLLDSILRAITLPRTSERQQLWQGLPVPEMPALKEFIIVAQNCLGYERLYPRVTHWLSDHRVFPGFVKKQYGFYPCKSCV